MHQGERDRHKNELICCEHEKKWILISVHFQTFVGLWLFVMSFKHKTEENC